MTLTSDSQAAAIPSGSARSHLANSNLFLATLPPKDHALLASHLRQISLICGTVLHRHGDPIEQVYFPHGGMVSIVVTMADGAVVEAATLGRAGVVCANAALGSRQAVGQAVVQLSGTASRIALSHFELAAQQSPAIHELAVSYNDLMLRQVQQLVACNTLHALEQRLCRWLLQAHDCCPGNTVPITQECLSQMLGVRRTSVTFAARLLQSKHLISYYRGLVTIVDRTALEHAACECYATMREHIEQLFPGAPQVEERA